MRPLARETGNAGLRPANSDLIVVLRDGFRVSDADRAADAGLCPIGRAKEGFDVVVTADEEIGSARSNSDEDSAVEPRVPGKRGSQSVSLSYC